MRGRGRETTGGAKGVMITATITIREVVVVVGRSSRGTAKGRPKRDRVSECVRIAIKIPKTNEI